jgi:subtilisin-like proprotein convertase family protein
MRSKRSRLALFGVLALALSVTAGLTISDVAAGKKKKGGGGATKTFTKGGGPIPDPFANPSPTGNGGSADFHQGLLSSKITVGRKFAGAKIKDLNVQVSASHVDISDLSFDLIGPNGQLITLSAGNSNGPTGFTPSTVFGPTTFDDQAALFINDTNSCPSGPDAALDCVGAADGGNAEAFAPYAGSFKPEDGTLASLGSKLMGNWILLAIDTDPFTGGGDASETGRLNNWKLIAQLKGGGGKKKK